MRPDISVSVCSPSLVLRPLCLGPSRRFLQRAEGSSHGRSTQRRSARRDPGGFRYCRAEFFGTPYERSALLRPSSPERFPLIGASTTMPSAPEPVNQVVADENPLDQPSIKAAGRVTRPAQTTPSTPTARLGDVLVALTESSTQGQGCRPSGCDHVLPASAE